MSTPPPPPPPPPPPSTTSSTPPTSTSSQPPPTTLPPHLAQTLSLHLRSTLFTPLQNTITALTTTCTNTLTAQSDAHHTAHMQLTTVVHPALEKLVPVAEELRACYGQIDKLEKLTQKIDLELARMRARIERAEKNVAREEKVLEESERGVRDGWREVWRDPEEKGGAGMGKRSIFLSEQEQIGGENVNEQGEEGAAGSTTTARFRARDWVVDGVLRERVN